jgi:2-(1,2-epoxy-1,2-dihydrophenyl)acetyl-CoA isomerase
MDSLLIDKKNRVVTLTINRPQVRNAVDMDTMIALGNEIRAVDAQDEYRVIVITGAGGAFSSGADIMAGLQQSTSPGGAHKILTDAYAPTLKAIRACKWPVIAAVDGMAAGISCDMAMTCDLRLVSERGAFAELFIRVGLIPDGGGTYLLPRLVGLGKAMEMMFTGETVNAQDALAIGLANKIYPVDTFYESVQTYAEKIAGQAPMALIRGKKAMLAALHDPSYDVALSREAEFQRELLESEDGLEGFRAFLEKRPPQWKGN